MTKQGGQGGGQERGHEYELVSPPGGPPVGEGTYKVPSHPTPSPMCPVEVGQRGREMWCMNSFLENSDCILQGTCSVTSHECVTCTVDVDIRYNIIYSVLYCTVCDMYCRCRY